MGMCLGHMASGRKPERLASPEPSNPSSLPSEGDSAPFCPPHNYRPLPLEHPPTCNLSASASQEESRLRLVRIPAYMFNDGYCCPFYAGKQRSTLLVHRLPGSTSSRTCFLSRQNRSLRLEAMLSVAQVQMASAHGGSIKHQTGIETDNDGTKESPLRAARKANLPPRLDRRPRARCCYWHPLRFLLSAVRSPNSLIDRHCTNCQRHGEAPADTKSMFTCFCM